MIFPFFVSTPSGPSCGCQCHDVSRWQVFFGAILGILWLASIIVPLMWALDQGHGWQLWVAAIWDVLAFAAGLAIISDL